MRHKISDVGICDDRTEPDYDRTNIIGVGIDRVDVCDNIGWTPSPNSTNSTSWSPSTSTWSVAAVVTPVKTWPPAVVVAAPQVAHTLVMVVAISFAWEFNSLESFHVKNKA